MKKKKEEDDADEYVSVCPRCGSTKILHDWVGDNAAFRNVCSDCRLGEDNDPWKLRVFPKIKKSDIEGFRKELKANPMYKE